MIYVFVSKNFCNNNMIIISSVSINRYLISNICDDDFNLINNTSDNNICALFAL